MEIEQVKETSIRLAESEVVPDMKSPALFVQKHTPVMLVLKDKILFMFSPAFESDKPALDALLLDSNSVVRRNVSIESFPEVLSFDVLCETRDLCTFSVPEDSFESWMEALQREISGLNSEGDQVSSLNQRLVVEKALGDRILETKLDSLAEFDADSSDRSTFIEKSELDTLEDPLEVKAMYARLEKHIPDPLSSGAMEFDKDLSPQSSFTKSDTLEPMILERKQDSPPSRSGGGDLSAARAEASKPAPKSGQLFDAKIWVFSWNMGVKDPFKPVDTDPERIKSAAADLKRQLLAFIPKGYDLYVIGVQECITDEFFSLFGDVLSGEGYDCVRVPISPEHDRVWGRGDGSFLSPKYTGIALYVSGRCAAHFKIVNAGASSLSVFEGSKGAAAVAVRLGTTTIALACAHLPAKSIEDRRRAYRLLVKNLGSVLGHAQYELITQFHHVIFFGDLNYRTNPESISLKDALKLISTRSIPKLRDHDELLKEIAGESAFYHFWEPRFAPDFLPSYKKKENRPIPLDYSKADWVEENYRTQYKEPWYKSGKIQPRVPSFCDRILVHSAREVPSVLLPEEFSSSSDNYHALNDYLAFSDHSAVCAGFKFQTIFRAPVEPLERKFKLTLLSIFMGKSDVKLLPKAVWVTFPAPFEDGNDSPVAHVIERELLDSSVPKVGSLSFNWSSRGLYPSLRMIIKVVSETDVTGECSIPFRTEDFLVGKEVKISEVLTRNGVPILFSGGSKLMVEGTAKLSAVKPAAKTSSKSKVGTTSHGVIPLGMASRHEPITEPRMASTPLFQTAEESSSPTSALETSESDTAVRRPFRSELL